MDIKPGNVCIFDPYNLLNQKEGYNDVVCVRVTKIHKKLFSKTTADFFDINTNRLFQKMPIELLYKIDGYLDPITVIRNPISTPVIDDTDIKIIEYCMEHMDDPIINKLLSSLKTKLEIYKVSSLFTNGG